MEEPEGNERNGNRNGDVTGNPKELLANVGLNGNRECRLPFINR
jgi:hypothetical protein